MMITDWIELRPENEESYIVCGECIICDALMDVRRLDMRTCSPPSSDYFEIYVEGEDTGFVVCASCCTRPSLTDEVQAWVVDVIYRVRHETQH